MGVMKMVLRIVLLATLLTFSKANTITLTEGLTCGQSRIISSLSHDARTYVCKDHCPRTYSATNGTSLLESFFKLGEFPCAPVPSSPLISRPGNIGCYLALSDDEVSPVTAWSFFVELTNENGVLMSTAFGEIILSNKRVRVRSADGNHEADIGRVIQLSRRTHFILLIRRQVQDVHVDVYIDGIHSGSTTSYPVPFPLSIRSNVTFGGCDICGSNDQRSLVGQIEDIRKFQGGLTDREAKALYNGSLPEVTPTTSCLCPPAYPFDVTSANGASFACAPSMQQGPASTSDLVSRFYNSTNGAYYTDISFLTDGMTSSFVENRILLPSFWLSEAGPVTFYVQFPSKPSIISNVKIYMLSDLPSEGIWIYKGQSSALLHVLGDCSQTSSNSMAYNADDVTCTDFRNVLPGSTLMEWRALDRPGTNGTVMTSSVMRHLSADGITIQFKGSPRSGESLHAISEIEVDARPLMGNMCQCYVQQSKSCKCSCNSKDASANLAASSCEPQITKIYPEVGSLNGGTSMTISGSNLLPKVTEVMIGGIPCNIQPGSSESRVICKTGNAGSVMSDVPVKVTMENGFYFYAQDRFNYLAMPIVDSIQPLEIFDSGGRMVTVTGSNLGVPGASLTVQNGKLKSSDSAPCITRSDTKLICHTPEVNMSSYDYNDRGQFSSGKDFNMGITWPEVNGLESLTATRAAGQKSFQPKIFASPYIYFEDGTAVFRAYESDEFTFKGDNLLSDLVSEDDYSVKVGGYDVEILEVTRETLKCKLPKNRPEAVNRTMERNTLLLAQVDAGTTSFEPGYIKWFDTIWDDVSARIVILCAVFAVLMVSLVIALTIIARRKSKKEQEALPAADPMPAKSTFGDHNHNDSSTEKLINMVDGEYMANLQKCLVTDSDSLSRNGGHVRGNFGDVIHGEYSLPNPGSQLVYIKIVKDRNRNSKKRNLESHISKVDGYLRDAGVLASLLPKDFCSQIGSGKDLIHPNIHPLVALAFSGTQVFFVYPRCKATDLKFYLRHPDVHCTVTNLIKIVKDIAKGMEYLHSNDIIHCDVAARNCVITKDGCVAISDAVLSDDFYPEDYSLPLGGSATRSFPIRWMSPRYLTTGNCNFFTDDIFSFGITTWEVLTRCDFPYADMTNQAVLGGVPEGMRPEQPHHCPDELFDLMTTCWSPNFKLRPSFEYIMIALETMGNPQTSTTDSVIELNARSPPEVFQQEVVAPHVQLANSGGAYFNLGYRNDKDVTTKM